jgi:hypothetical protein
VLIALLVVLGVDLIVIVAFVAMVVGRRRRLKRQPGQFAGAIRLTSGDIDGLSPTWKRGSGRWVRDVLVWSKGPFMFRTAVLPVDRLLAEHPAPAGELKRLGDEPVVVALECENAAIDVAARAEHRALVIGLWSTPPTVGQASRKLSPDQRPQ